MQDRDAADDAPPTDRRPSAPPEPPPPGWAPRASVDGRPVEAYRVTRSFPGGETVIVVERELHIHE